MSTDPMPPARIAFWHRKGGTGKTSLAIGCAVRLAGGSAADLDADPHSPAQGARVLLLDTDPQGTAAAWGERFADRFGIAVRADSGFALWHDWAERAMGFDAVLVDCPPTVGPEVMEILAGVDRLLIPTRPAWPDVWALESVADLVADLHLSGGRGRRAHAARRHRSEERTWVRLLGCHAHGDTLAHRRHARRSQGWSPAPEEPVQG
ncbi:ParA family protein [Thiocapsa sp. UBA6158]|uniref:ParA family protein n=1 Tax=Thiocapsa sp. UBA6158 TaxID=1947692 RepID=UPI0025E25452|nr:ParA family protein [Thiocapsa sp. UBA6158]